MVDLDKHTAGTSGQPDGGGSKLLGVLAFWTFAGTIGSLIAIWAPFTGTGWLWPTMIRPHWLGTIIGAVAFIVLTSAYQATARPKPRATVDPELTAGRARVATALRARIAQQQAAQRPE